jgi:peptidoglycan/xylan/chitin deacetylase (PgdA/CDA1 family)
MYHDVVDLGFEDGSGFRGRDAALYKLPPDRFARHLDTIVRDLPPSASAREVVLTFDDGGASAMRIADALERRRLTGFFFIATNYIGTPGFLRRADIVELAKRGHVVGSHSCSHPLRMGHCERHQLSYEWTRSRAVLSDTIGGPVTIASVPGGDFSRAVADAAAEAGYDALFTSEPTGQLSAIGPLTIHGRFTIQRWTSAKTAAALLHGDVWSCARQAIVWNAKKLLKSAAGHRYLEVRQRLLRSSDVQSRG